MNGKCFLLAGMGVLLLPTGRPVSGSAEDNGITPNAVVITREELENGLYEYDLFGLLAALRVKTGITVKSSSDIGAEDWLLIRGLPRDSARNVLVLIDGMPLNDAFSEANEFEHLPPFELIDRVVVYKPPLPARFGGYASAIEIVTREAPAETGAELALAGGEYDTQSGSVLAEGYRNGLSYRFAADVQGTDNLTGVSRTPPQQGQVYGDRSYEKIHPALQVTYHPGDSSRIWLSADYLESEKFFSDTIFRGEKEGRDRTIGSLNLNYRWTSPEASRFLLNLFRSDEDYRLNLIQHPDVEDQDRTKQGTRLAWSRALPGNQHLSLGGDFTDLRVAERGATPLGLTGEQFYGLFVEDVITVADRWDLTLGARYDGHSETGSHWSPNASVVFRTSGSTTGYAVWGESARWPALSEFDSRDPDLGLAAEELRSLEFGLRQGFARGKGRFRIGMFRTDLENESLLFLDFTVAPPLIFQGNAPDRIRSEGVELETELGFNRTWSGFLNYTYDEIERRPGGASVDFSGPRHLANLGVTWTKSRGHLSLTTRYNGTAEGVQSMMGLPTRLDSWLVVDLAGRLQLSGHADLFLRAGNLFDEEYETFDGRPMFGRSTMAGVKVLF